jgi:hypothetical protein
LNYARVIERSANGNAKLGIKSLETNAIPKLFGIASSIFTQNKISLGFR